MDRLTQKEEEIMQILWDIERAFVKDIIDQLPVPKPPYSTISSIVRILESKGFVSHKQYGNTYEYFPIIKKEDYRKKSFVNLLQNYFHGSATDVVSFLIQEKKLTKTEIEELKSIINNSGTN